MPHLIFKSGVFVATLLISACSGTANQSSPTEVSPAYTSPSDENTGIEDDDRGFDPCILNDQLAVCNENENTNSE